MYAKMQGWATNNTQRGEIEKTLDTIPTPKLPDEREEIQQLLNTRKYVVLQGAPGTGKTWNALEIAKKYDKTYFEQFHAETTYSDFVYGLEPNCDTKAGETQFQPKRGVLYLAVKYALDNPTKKVLLIIDEINRANLSNVLGPVFFLFEYQANNRTVSLKLGDLEHVDSLPDNLHVIATMNTADRSLAVVDFALRRRFAWYTLRPHILDSDLFDKDTFNRIADIFYQYASDEELNLQPGQSYFTDKTNMKDRMIYELMPLIKEYLAEGYLLNAKDEFCTLFLEETDKMMYE
jgi:5-methylcytosine-specific restriction endonuclease McrBC GTP-binding regulatory subunit McrB